MRTDQTVLQAKRFGVFSCSQDTSLLEASQRMVEEDISALVVVDQQGGLAGIITRTDLLRAFVQTDDWGVQPISLYMNPNVVAVGPHTRLTEVAEILVGQRIHRVVVVREENGVKKPISVVSGADLVYHMVKSA